MLSSAYFFITCQLISFNAQFQIFDEKVEFTEIASPKVGSMDKVKHKPGGGDKKVKI